MNANRIKIACFGDDGTEYAREFDGPAAVWNAANFFMAQMGRDDWERVRHQFEQAGRDAMRVGEWRAA